MRTQFYKLALAAGFGLALAFTFSACSSEDPPPSSGGEPNNNQNSGGNEPINPQNPTCGSVQYNPETEQCCGNSKYTTSTQFCSGGTVYDKCGGYEYNPSTNFCSGNTAYAKCDGSVVYNPATEQCCGSDKFNTSTQFCGISLFNIEHVYDKCGGSVVYNPATEQCCGSDKFNTSTQFCGISLFNIGHIYDKCGGSVQYNPETEQCCGISKFTTSTQYCSDGTVKNYGSLTDSYDGKKYKTVVIGTQTWMAENLNSEAGGRCYGNKSANCTKYGRLYNWETAKTACPSGWHLPSDAEWDVLVNYAGGPSTAGKKLKATSGWTDFSGNPADNGADNYGFAALPGGFGYSSAVGSYGRWWDSSDDTALDAYYWTMSYDGEGVIRNIGYKEESCSVRCLQN